MNPKKEKIPIFVISDNSQVKCNCSDEKDFFPQTGPGVQSSKANTETIIHDDTRNDNQQIGGPEITIEKQ